MLDYNSLTTIKILRTLIAIIILKRLPSQLSITSFIAINKSISLFTPDSVEDPLAKINITLELRHKRFISLLN